MNPDEFRLRVESAKRKDPVLFALGGDPPASVEEILNAEASLGVRFPENYRAFLGEYGGGYFALATVFSVKSGSRWNVVDRNREARLAGGAFLAISDNGVGDYYGFQVVDGVCLSPIVFWDHEEMGRVSATSFGDLYEFLTQVAILGK